MPRQHAERTVFCFATHTLKIQWYLHAGYVAGDPQHPDGGGWLAKSGRSPAETCPLLSNFFGWLPPLVLSPHSSFGWLAVFIGWRHNNRCQSICNYMARHLQHSSVFCGLSVCSCGGCTHHQLSPLSLESPDSLHIPCNINPDLSGWIVYTLQALLIGLAAYRFGAHSVLGGGGDGNPNLV